MKHASLILISWVERICFQGHELQFNQIPDPVSEHFSLLTSFLLR